MKKQVERTKRLAGVLKQIHEIENVRLLAARQLLAERRQEERVLIEALLTSATGEVPFLRSLGRRLDAATRNVEHAADAVERIQAECLDAMTKHSAIDRRADKAQAILAGLQERTALTEIIEAFVNSSVPQARSSSMPASVPGATTTLPSEDERHE
jgi:hypothetical protein